MLLIFFKHACCSYHKSENKHNYSNYIISMRSKLPFRRVGQVFNKEEPSLVALFIAQKNVFGQMEERFSEYDLVFKGYG